jgi:hypothetical protein
MDFAAERRAGRCGFGGLRAAHPWNSDLSLLIGVHLC